MALDEAPPFWWQKPSIFAFALAPVAYFYGRVAGIRMMSEPSGNVPVPVICVGNFVTGGAGKTPTVQMLTRFVRKAGRNPGILSRGHGGAINSATVVKLERHNAHDVGDEALLHAALATTVVSPDRPEGATLLVEQGCDFIIMDDGFQNPGLEKDYNLVVIDAKRGIGNGFTMPAGPMRVPLKTQMLKADGIMVIGDEDGADKIIRRAARAAKPIFHASISVIGKTKIKGMKALAFAGIADPSKFFDTLKNNKVKVEDNQAFGDHHVFLADECRDLMERAEKSDLQLMTTTKDMARLKDMGDDQNKLAEASMPIMIELKPDDPGMLERIVTTAIERARKRKLRAAETQKPTPEPPVEEESSTA